MKHPLRTGARVLLADSRDRVLLFRLRSRRRAGYVWITPGGGVEVGENLAQAAVRELHEEAGYKGEPHRLGQAIAISSVDTVIHDRPVRAVNWYFFVRVDTFDIDGSQREAYEQEIIVGHHWWSVQELMTTNEVIVPPGLPHLLQRLLIGDSPVEPVRLA